jgi:hypothetical protein
VRIPPATKYTLGRLGLFVVAFVLAAFVPLGSDAATAWFLRVMIAGVASAIASWFLLARWRNEMASTIERSMDRRRADKERLRSALAGEDDGPLK